jgi:aconitate hydratase
MGAVDAFRGAPRGDVAATARALRARGERWVVVGDANYGEGSSREHAALSPRWLGGAAVIARSFARIHESNLKKQGLLALSFGDPADYERVREDDRVSLLRLAQLAAGTPVECVLSHADGSRERLWLSHSYTDAQLEWFRAGSALNALRREETGSAS